MKITFVALGSEQLPVSLLSAIAKREGHEVGLAFSASLFHDRYNLEIPSISKYFEDTDDTIQAIRDQKPDVLAFSVLTSTYRWMLEVAREAKEINPNVKTVFGGVHVSAVPERVLAQPEADYVVVGEGDYAFPEILKAIEKGGSKKPISNTRFKTPNGEIIRGVQEGFIQDLDALPAFDKSLWEEHIRVGDKWLTMASRGCPYRCSFCFNNFFANLPEGKKGKYVRQRSVDHMMNELILAKKKYKLRYIEFQDDIFTVNKEWLKEFLIRYKKEINLPFQCLTHPRYMDIEVAQWLKEAGCIWTQMGVQTMDEGFKKGSLKRYESSEHIVKSLEAMHKAGLKTKVDHMFGLPNEPLEAQETARKLYANQSPRRIQTFWTCYLPGTDMMKEGIEAGDLTPEQVNRLNDGIDFYFYRNEDNIKDPELLEAYRAYHFLFRIFPLLPGFVRKRLLPGHVKWIPNIVGLPIAYIMDIISGFVYGNPDIIAYSQHYLFHLYRFAVKKMGLGRPKAVVPRYVETAEVSGKASKNLQENKSAA